MNNRRWILLVAAVFAIGITVYIVRGQLISPSTGDLKRNDTATFWPADQAWAWTFKFPPDISPRSHLSLHIRGKSSPLAPGANPAYQGGPPTAQITAAQSESDIVDGDMLPLSGPAPQPQDGTVTIQLLDLSKIGAMPIKPGQNLRILPRLAVGGSTVFASDDVTFLPAGQFAGSDPMEDAHWINGELFIMRFYVRTADKYWEYDTVLECTPDQRVH